MSQDRKESKPEEHLKEVLLRAVAAYRSEKIAKQEEGAGPSGFFAAAKYKLSGKESRVNDLLTRIRESSSDNQLYVIAADILNGSDSDRLKTRVAVNVLLHEKDPRVSNPSKTGINENTEQVVQAATSLVNEKVRDEPGVEIKRPR